VDYDGIERQSSGSRVFETEFAYMLEGIKDRVQVFIVGFSCEKIAYKKSKIKFLSGLGYAIYVAAFNLDEDESPSSEEEDEDEEAKEGKEYCDGSKGGQATTDEGKRKKSLERLEAVDAINSSLDTKTFSPRPLNSSTPHPSSANLVSAGSVSSGSIRGSDGGHSLVCDEDNDIEQLVRRISTKNLIESGLAGVIYSGGAGVWKDRESFDSEEPGTPSRESEEEEQVEVVQRKESVDRFSSHSSVPTWDPMDSFSYPVADIPLKCKIPNNLTLDCFSEVKHIADGSNSNIFLVKWRKETVIVKMIKKQVQSDPIAVHEFDVEHGILTRLSHPRIVKLLGSGWQPRRFLVLEYMGGGSLNALMAPNQTSSGGLAQRLFRRPTFTYAMLLQRAKEIAEALEYLHCEFHQGATIIHRDLKPDNVGFTTSGELKLFDFGLCTCVKTRKDIHEAYEMTGNTGSLRYMVSCFPCFIISSHHSDFSVVSLQIRLLDTTFFFRTFSNIFYISYIFLQAPEVALRKPYTEKADVFSFGIMIWQMARDRVPFKGVSRDEFFSHVIYKGQRPKLDKSWPSGFSKLLTDCWDKDPRLRPSFDDIVARLTNLINALGIKAPQKTLISPTLSSTSSKEVTQVVKSRGLERDQPSRFFNTTPTNTLLPEKKNESKSTWF